MADAGVTKKNLERATEIVKNNPSMDLHTHLGYWEGKGLTDVFELCAYSSDDKIRANLEAMIAGNCKSVQLCLTGDNPILDLSKPGNKKRDYKGDEAWDEYRRERGVLEDFFKTMPMELATSVDDIDGIFSSGKLAVFLTTEGGHMVQENTDRVEQLYKDGVRRLQPIHYVHSKLGDSQTDPSAFGGLSPFGIEAVKKAIKLGMVIDAAHASFEAAKDMAHLAAGPIVLSHTMMKFDSPKYGSYLETRPRFVTKDHAFMIAETGGVIGTWLCIPPYGTESLDAYTEATKKMVDTVGIDHVGWATDYIDSSMPDFFNDYKLFPTICASLLDAGFSDGDLIKFIGGNAIRVIKEVDGA